jgi:hypothetical protein
MTGFFPDFTISSASKQYIQVPIAPPSGDPTSDAVSMAFSAIDTEPITFYSGNWVTKNGLFYARTLVGPGSAAVLSPGYYEVYVKITDNPEVPVILSGLLEVT